MAALEIESRVISKVIQDKNLIPVLQRNINNKWFLDDDHRRVWDLVIDHYNTYGEVPNDVVVHDNFPNYNLIEVEESIEYLLDTMVDNRRKYLTRLGLDKAVDTYLKQGHEDAVTEMERAVTLINEQGVNGTHQVDLTKNTKERYEEYKALKNLEFLGIPTGFEQIDEATAGLQGGQLITIIAPPKTGKSQLALKIAMNVHALGYKPLFQSFEMNNREQQQRYDAIRAHVSYNDYRKGNLTQTEEDRLIDSLNEVETMNPFILSDATNGITVSALAAKIHQTNPDIIFVDGVYLMIDEISGEQNTPAALTNITRSLKRLAQKLNKPIVISTQTLLWKMKGKKVSADSIGYSSSFFQDSDVILGLEPTENEDEYARTLRVVSSRNCAPIDTPIVWNWNTGCFHDESEGTKCTYCVNWAMKL